MIIIIIYHPSHLIETHHLLYSRKYWLELNLEVGSQLAITKKLADFNLVVWYRIAIRILYASKKFWRILIWQLQRQTTKFSSYTVCWNVVYVWTLA